MKGTIVFGAIALCVTGCASTGIGAPRLLAVEEVPASKRPSVRAGDAHVLDPSISPLAPVHVAPDGGTISVRFAHPRAGALLHLDPQSLLPVAPTEVAPDEQTTQPGRAPAHAVLKSGRLLVCWRRGDLETGYRLMAQAWTAGGEPLGPPVAVSPEDVDVVGSAQMVALDGDRALATFAAASGDRFELLAVSLEVH